MAQAICIEAEFTRLNDRDRFGVESILAVYVNQNPVQKDWLVGRTFKVIKVGKGRIDLELVEESKEG